MTGRWQLSDLIVAMHEAKSWIQSSSFSSKAVANPTSIVGALVCLLVTSLSFPSQFSGLDTDRTYQVDIKSPKHICEAWLRYTFIFLPFFALKRLVTEATAEVKNWWMPGEAPAVKMRPWLSRCVGAWWWFNGDLMVMNGDLNGDIMVISGDSMVIQWWSNGDLMVI